MESLIEWSYRDFHVKGFDYVCVQRSPECTVKFYFFDGVDAAKQGMLGEVVNPHDHRYDFTTSVLAGEVENICYRDCGRFGEHRGAAPYNRLLYRTPLNGGSGFEMDGAAWLMPARRQIYARNESYTLRAEALHTIRVQPDTVLRLVQFADYDLDHTLTFVPHGHAVPKLDGLYSKFTPDQMNERLKQLTTLGWRAGIPIRGYI